MNRRSIRRYSGKPISKEEKETILKAACAAPSAGNQQMYTIIDVTDQKLKEALAISCDNQPFIAQGEIVLVFCADTLKWHEGFIDCDAGPRPQGPGDLALAITDTCIAAQNAVIAAESLGIGSCYIGDILENCEKHRELLQLPEYVLPCAMIVFGYPDPSEFEKTRTKRAPLEYIVSENCYPKMDAEYRYGLFGKGMDKDKYEEWMKAFCTRKYNSGFAKEMQRSVNEYLKQYK